MKNRSGFGWMEFMIGILLTAIGIITFLYPGRVLTGMVWLYGILAIVTGIVDIVFYIHVERSTGFIPVLALTAGLLTVICGLMLIFYPAAGKLVLSLFFPVWFIAHCISRLSRLPIIRRLDGKFAYYFTMVVNIIGIILGFLMMFRPLITLLSVTYLIGAYLILLGADDILSTFGKMDTRG